MVIFKEVNKLSEKTQLVMIMGVPCSGKSTLAKLIASKVKYAYLDTDTMSDELLKALCLSYGVKMFDTNSDIYMDKISHLEKSALYNCLVENLSLGISCVVPAVFGVQSNECLWLHDFLKDNNLTDIEVKIIQLNINDEENLLNRIKVRGSSRDYLKINNWSTYWDSIKNYDVLWDFEKLCINNTNFGSIDCIDNIIKFIKGESI